MRSAVTVRHTIENKVQHIMLVHRKNPVICCADLGVGDLELDRIVFDGLLGICPIDTLEGTRRGVTLDKLRFGQVQRFRNRL